MPPATTTRNLKCTVCQKEFNEMRRLNVHIKRHIGLKLYCCSDCTKTCYTAQELNRHQIGKHGLPRPYACPQIDCDKNFGQRSTLNSHLKAIHGILKPYECSKCKKRFRLKKELLLHEANHEISNSKKKKSKRSRRKKKLEKVATENKNLHQFSSKIQLDQKVEKMKKIQNQQEQDETKNKKKQVVQKFNLQCNCGKYFSSSSKFKLHRQATKHRRPKIHECHFCVDETFRTIRALELHFNKFHCHSEEEESSIYDSEEDGPLVHECLLCLPNIRAFPDIEALESHYYKTHEST